VGKSHPIDPVIMAMRGRIGAFRLHSRYDAKETTAPARAGLLRRFEREVDPDNQLEEAERKRRAEYARRAWMAQLAHRSAMARAHKVPKRLDATDALPAVSDQKEGKS
jgi:hypothetical protein